MDSRIFFVVSAIETGIPGNLDPIELAATVNLSVSRLRHLFKAEIGVTLARHIRDARLEKARSLLVTTFLSIKEVMNRAGISDNSNFAHEFKRTFGATPSSYRSKAQRSPLIAP